VEILLIVAVVLDKSATYVVFNTRLLISSVIAAGLLSSAELVMVLYIYVDRALNADTRTRVKERSFICVCRPPVVVCVAYLAATAVDRVLMDELSCSVAAETSLWSAMFPYVFRYDVIAVVYVPLLSNFAVIRALRGSVLMDVLIALINVVENVVTLFARATYSCCDGRVANAALTRVLIFVTFVLRSVTLVEREFRSAALINVVLRA
jgi:hypothetical protein